METAETVAITSEHLREQLAKIRYQVECLSDIALSVDDDELEANLRKISTEIRYSLDAIASDAEADEPWLAGQPFSAGAM